VPEDGSGAYARASSGFMGKQWDTGETAFAVEFWAECLRVLKPGGHVVAFSGTRTYHRMACAIEDAGFEVRDMLSWLYGSGFPKSHDVSKGIDRAAVQTARRFEPQVPRHSRRQSHGSVAGKGIGSYEIE
jgi:DNA modification methylase